MNKRGHHSQAAAHRHNLGSEWIPPGMPMNDQRSHAERRDEGGRRCGEQQLAQVPVEAGTRDYCDDRQAEHLCEHQEDAGLLDIRPKSCAQEITQRHQETDRNEAKHHERHLQQHPQRNKRPLRLGVRKFADENAARHMATSGESKVFG